MNEVERAILDKLKELEDAVRAMPTANPKPNLLPIFARLDELGRQLPKTGEATLLHYLQRKSYEKARLWLEGRIAENAPGDGRRG